MLNFIRRLRNRTSASPQTEPTTGPGQVVPNAALEQHRVQLEGLKEAGHALLEGRPAEFLAKLPQLERLDLLDPQGQSYEHEFLLEAAARGHLDVIRALVARGAAVTGTGRIRLNAGPGNTALHAAAAEGQLEVARFLLAQGADVNAMNGWGETPLHCAVARGNLELVASLLERGADVNARRPGSDMGTPLWRAVEKVLFDVTKYLLDHGADPRLINDAKNQSPLVGAHRSFEEACRQFHQVHGEERAQIGARLKQLEALVNLLEQAERHFGAGAR